MSKSIRKVVGLQYEPGEGLPTVILKGSGAVVEEVLRRRDPIYGPEVLKNPELVEKLFALPIDAEIRPDLYHLVAAVFVHLYRLDKQMEDKSHG